jgi:hypothetical protein
MQELFKEIETEYLLDIQSELKEFVLAKGLIKQSKKPYAHLADYKQFKNLAKFVDSRKKLDIVWSKFYFTPPNVKWGIHKDGVGLGTFQIAINIPIINYTESINYWYDVEEYNFLEGNFGDNNSKNTIVKDKSLCKEISRTEIKKITLIRTDVFHSVENKSKSDTRVNYVIRFPIKYPSLNFEDVFC